MQWTDESGGAYGGDPYGGIGYTHAQGHAGVRTMVPPEPGEPTRPVFVDASGRRQRRVLRAARLLVIPAGGYVALLIGALLGGPSISSPFVPQSEAHPATPRATAPDSASGTGHSTERATATPTRRTPGTAGRPAASTAPAATPGSAASTTNTSASGTGSKAAPGSRGRGHGSSHKPVK